MDDLPVDFEIDLNVLADPARAASAVEALFYTLGVHVFVRGGTENLDDRGQPALLGDGQVSARALADMAKTLWTRAEQRPHAPWGHSDPRTLHLSLQLRPEELRHPFLAEARVGNLVYKLAQAVFESAGEHNVRRDGGSVLRGNGHHLAQQIAADASERWTAHARASAAAAGPRVGPSVDETCTPSVLSCASRCLGGVHSLCTPPPAAFCAPLADVCAETAGEGGPFLPAEAQRHSAREVTGQALQRIFSAYDKVSLSGLYCSLPLVALSTLIRGGQEIDSEDCSLRLQMIVSLYDLAASKGISYAVQDDGLALREAIGHARRVLSLA